MHVLGPQLGHIQVQLLRALASPVIYRVSYIRVTVIHLADHGKQNGN